MTTQSSLPYVDELPIEIDADREETWAELLRVVEGSFASARGRGPARLLACEDTEPSGPRPLAKGSAFPGLKGSFYRALVIGTRMHVLVTRRILTATKRRAERS